MILAPTLATLLGLSLAGLIIWRSRGDRLRLSEATASETKADLEAQAEHAVDVLVDLEANKERIDHESYKALHREVSQEAADALRARAEQAHPDGAGSESSASSQPDGESASKSSSPLFAFVGGLATMGVLAGIVWSISQDANPRGVDGSMTGNDQSIDGGGTESSNSEMAFLAQEVAKNPKDMDTVLLFTERLLDLGHFNEAEIYVQRLQKELPDDPATKIWGAFFESRSNPKGAAASLQAVLATADVPKNRQADAWFYLGLISFVGERQEEARSHWEKFAEVADPGPRRDQVMQFLRGEVPAQPSSQPSSQGGAEPPFVALERQLAESPNDLSALTELTTLYLRMQRLGEAAELNKRAAAIAPTDKVVRMHAAVLKSSQGDTAGGLQDLAKVLEEHPKFADGWFFRGMIGMMSGQPDLAQESWKKFVEVAPEGPRKERIKGFLRGEGLQMPGR